MPVKSEPLPDEARLRDLPDRITIPPIDGEMLKLRPASLDDLPKLDTLDAFYNASRITGKDMQSERAAVRTWVRRSVAWAQGVAADKSGVGDPESRRTIAWSIIAEPSHSDEEQQGEVASTDGFIGMIFLIDIDGWARSARIQVVLGRDYRGRGYSRDAMPRVMTYGFAPWPAGLGMHRIWVAVPEKNSRSLSVYQSLGFELTGTSRDALWDAENGKYQDLNVLDTLVDEYDPIRSLDAFGMHVIEHNPGVQEALSAREHSLAIEQRLAGRTAKGTGVGHRESTRPSKTDVLDNIEDVHDHVVSGNMSGERLDPTNMHTLPGIRHESAHREPVDGGFETGDSETLSDDMKSRAEPAAPAMSPEDEAPSQDASEDEGWPYSTDGHKGSKRAWWRNFGRGHKHGEEGK